MAISGQNPLLLRTFWAPREWYYTYWLPKALCKDPHRWCNITSLRTKSDPITRPGSRVRLRKPANMVISGQNPLRYGLFEHFRTDIISTSYPKVLTGTTICTLFWPAQVLQTPWTKSDPITRPRSRVRLRKPANMAISGQNPLLLRGFWAFLEWYNTYRLPKALCIDPHRCYKHSEPSLTP